MDDFFRFSKKLGFWVFLAHPTVVSVLLSTSVEIFFVSRMRDFLEPNCSSRTEWAATTFSTFIEVAVLESGRAVQGCPYQSRLYQGCLHLGTRPVYWRVAVLSNVVFIKVVVTWAQGWCVGD